MILFNSRIISSSSSGFSSTNFLILVLRNVVLRNEGADRNEHTSIYNFTDPQNLPVVHLEVRILTFYICSPNFKSISSSFVSTLKETGTHIFGTESRSLKRTTPRFAPVHISPDFSTIDLKIFMDICQSHATILYPRNFWLEVNTGAFFLGPFKNFSSRE